VHHRSCVVQLVPWCQQGLKAASVMLCGRVIRHRQLQEPEVLAADDADVRRRDEMSDEEEEEELDEEVGVAL